MPSRVHELTRFGWRGVLPARVLDGVPGTVAWALMLASLLGVLLFPRTTMAVAALLAAYLSLRFTLATYANLRGLRTIARWQAADWRVRYLTSPPDVLASALPWDALHHLVIIPNYNEPPDVLRRTLDRLSAGGCAGAMTVVLAMEAREPGAEEKARALQAAYGDHFARVLVTLHPDGLPGEMRCKSANEGWAVRAARQQIVEEYGVNPDHVVVTTMDADTLWHPRYFDALTYHFATDPDRYRQFWQAPIRYHANIDRINPLMRLVNAYATAFELAFLTARWWMSLPMSSYSLSLRLLEANDYWDGDVIADEWHMFIKAYFNSGGVVRVQPIFLPFLASSPSGRTLTETIHLRYRQSLRHAWGSKELGYTLGRMLDAPHTPLLAGVRLLLRIVHDVVLPGAGWVYLMLATQLPLLVHPALRAEILAAPFGSPWLVLLHVALAFFFVMGLFVWLMDVRARPRHEQTQATTTPHEHLLVVTVGFVLMPLLTLLFVALPLLHAQTRLLAGSDLTFHVTRKQP